MAGTSTVVFGGSVTVNGPSGPTDMTLQPRTVAGVAASGAVWVYQRVNAKCWIWTVSLSSLTDAMKQAFENFFSDTANGQVSTFSYKHTDGITYQGVRFVDGELAWTRTSSNQWDTVVRLRVGTQPGTGGTSTTTPSGTTTIGI